MSYVSQTGFVKKQKRTNTMSAVSSQKSTMRRRESDNTASVQSRMSNKSGVSRTGSLKSKMNIKPTSQRIDWCFYVDCTIEQFMDSESKEEGSYGNNYLDSLYSLYKLSNNLPVNNFVYVYCSKEPANGITGKKLNSSVTVLGGCSLEVIKQKIPMNLIVLYNSLSFFMDNYVRDKPIVLWQTLETINFLNNVEMEWINVKNLVNNFNKLHSVIVDSSKFIHLGQNYKNYHVIPSGFRPINMELDKSDVVVSITIPQGENHSPDTIETAVNGLSKYLGKLNVAILVNNLEDNANVVELEKKNNASYKYEVVLNSGSELSKYLNATEYILYCPTKRSPELGLVLSYLNTKKPLIIEKSSISDLSIINNVTEVIDNVNSIDDWNQAGKNISVRTPEEIKNLEMSSEIVADKFNWNKVSQLWYNYVLKKYK